MMWAYIASVYENFFEMIHCIAKDFHLNLFIQLSYSL